MASLSHGAVSRREPVCRIGQKLLLQNGYTLRMTIEGPPADDVAKYYFIPSPPSLFFNHWICVCAAFSNLNPLSPLLLPSHEAEESLSVNKIIMACLAFCDARSQNKPRVSIGQGPSFSPFSLQSERQNNAHCTTAAAIPLFYDDDTAVLFLPPSRQHC